VLAMLRFLMTATGLVLIGLTVGTVLLLPQAERQGLPLLERVVSERLGTPFTCESARVTPLLPGFELTRVALLTGEEDPRPLLTCERVAVRVDPARLLSAEPLVREVLLDSPTLFVRPGAGTETNLSRFAADLAEKAIDGNLHVDRVRCINGKVSVAENVLPGDGVTVPLDTFAVEGGQDAGPVKVGLAALRRMLEPLAGLLP